MDASDIPTLASYNVALSRYIETGDAADTRPIMATVMRDTGVMAARTGVSMSLEHSPEVAK